MDEKLIIKMIQHSFKQYHYDVQSIPLTKGDYENLCRQIFEIHEDTNADLRDIINDCIYEFLTK